jgi:hypothetical protein
MYTKFTVPRKLHPLSFFIFFVEIFCPVATTVYLFICYNKNKPQLSEMRWLSPEGVFSCLTVPWVQDSNPISPSAPSGYPSFEVKHLQSIKPQIKYHVMLYM